MRGLFVTGTDTGVGKTHVSCAIIRELRAAGHRVGAYKPAVSGAIQLPDGRLAWEDVDALRVVLGRPVSDEQISPLRFVAPLAPPVAARAEGRTVERDVLRQGLAAWRDDCDAIVVEGAGGLLCPLTDTESMADLAVEFAFPLLIVARIGLGTINHSLLTVEAAHARGLRIAGIVLNEAAPSHATDLSVATNAEEIAQRSGVPVLAIRRHNANGWVGRFQEPLQLDWWSLCGESRSEHEKQFQN